MRCHDVQQFTSALVDGELDAPTALELEKHIASCEPCRTRAESERLVKRELRRRLGAVTAPAALRDRVQAALRQAAAAEAAEAAPGDVAAEAPRVPVAVAVRPTPIPAAAGPWAAPWNRLRPAVPVALAAGLALFFVAPQRWISLDEGPRRGGVTGAALGGPLVLSDVVGRHVRTLPPEVQGPNPERVASWFHGKVDFPVRPPVFDEDPAGLVGGRVSWVRDEPAAHLFYELDGRRVSVMVFARGPRLPVDGIPGLCVSNRKVWVGRSKGINVALLERDRVAYALASDLSESDIVRLAQGF